MDGCGFVVLGGIALWVVSLLWELRERYVQDERARASRLDWERREREREARKERLTDEMVERQAKFMTNAGADTVTILTDDVSVYHPLSRASAP
jgi:hypothetical protein